MQLKVFTVLQKIFGPYSKTCIVKVRAAWGRVSQGLTVSLKPSWKILSLAIHIFDKQIIVKSNALIAFLFMECKILAIPESKKKLLKRIYFRPISKKFIQRWVESRRNWVGIRRPKLEHWKSNQWHQVLWKGHVWKCLQKIPQRKRSPNIVWECSQGFGQ